MLQHLVADQKVEQEARSDEAVERVEHGADPHTAEERRVMEAHTCVSEVHAIDRPATVPQLSEDKALPEAHLERSTWRWRVRAQLVDDQGLVGKLLVGVSYGILRPSAAAIEVGDVIVRPQLINRRYRLDPQITTRGPDELDVGIRLTQHPSRKPRCERLVR